MDRRARRWDGRPIFAVPKPPLMTLTEENKTPLSSTDNSNADPDGMQPPAEHSGGDSHMENVEEAASEAANDEDDLIENLTRRELIDLLREQFSVGNLREAAVVAEEIDDAYQILKQRETPDADDELDTEYYRLRAEFRKHLQQKRAEYLQRLEKNYEVKRQIVDELRKLADSDELTYEHIRRFRQLRKQWQEAGPVPARLRHELERSFRFQADRFRKLQRDFFRLVEMDHAANLRAKQDLLEQMEALLALDDPFRMQAALRDILEEWNLYGHVPEEHKEDIWQRYHTLREQVRERIDQLRTERKALEAENEAKKERLIERVEQLTRPYDRRQDWERVTRVVRSIQVEFDQAEPVHPRRGGQLRRKMKEALDRFYDMRRAFYAEMHQAAEKRADALRQKYIQRVEELTHLEDMRGARKTVMEISDRFERELERADLPPKLRSQLRTEMKKAKDDFFTKWASYLAKRDLIEEENYKKKKQFIEQLRQTIEAGDFEDPKQFLKETFRKWNELGFVPLAKKQAIEEEFRAVVQKVLDQLGGDADIDKLRYRMGLEGLSREQLQERRKKLNADISHLSKEKDKLETNLEMFGDMGGSLMEDYQRRVKKLEEKIQRLREQRAVIDELLNA